MSRLRGAAAASGLMLIAASVPLFALGHDQWGPALLAVGLLGVAGYLVAALRATQRDLRTLAANLGRSRRQQLDTERARPAGTDLAAALGPVQEGLRSLAADLEALRDRPALRAWQHFGDRRREGTACLVAGRQDAAAVQAADRSGASFEVLDPVAGGGLGTPATPAHAVGAVLIDLDLFAAGPADRDGWSGYTRWLRAEVPVLGFTRVPERLSLGAAAVARATGGHLLPTAEGADLVRFDHVIEPEPEPGPETGAGPSAGSRP